MRDNQGDSAALSRLESALQTERQVVEKLKQDLERDGVERAVVQEELRAVSAREQEGLAKIRRVETRVRFSIR